MTSFVASHDMYAVFLPMAVDAVFSAASELLLLVGGALVTTTFIQHATLFGAELSKGAATFLEVAIAGTLGYLPGSLAGWAVGRYASRPRRDSSRCVSAPTRR
jgi:membrane protein YqaA with SNARE-associated domain